MQDSTVNNIDNNFETRTWMAATPAINMLSISELTLPGTHNAGSDWLASYPFYVPRYYVACQHASFYSQLLNGARALDLRLIYDEKAEGARQFQAHHGGVRSSRTLHDLIIDIESFLQLCPDEFIVLDFHELDGNNFDYEQFNKTMIQLLGHRLIPSKNLPLSLHQLKQASSQQRVFAAAKSHWQLDYHVFNNYISHKWSGIDRTDPNELKQFIERVMQVPPGSWAPWSLSATSYTARRGPARIPQELNAWFDPAKSDWAMKCNIINVDFIEDSRIVSYCRTVNLEKARRKVARTTEQSMVA